MEKCYTSRVFFYVYGSFFRPVVTEIAIKNMLEMKNARIFLTIPIQQSPVKLICYSYNLLLNNGIHAIF